MGMWGFFFPVKELFGLYNKMAWDVIGESQEGVRRRSVLIRSSVCDEGKLD